MRKNKPPYDNPLRVIQKQLHHERPNFDIHEYLLRDSDFVYIATHLDGRQGMLLLDLKTDFGRVFMVYNKQETGVVLDQELIECWIAEPVTITCMTREDYEYRFSNIKQLGE